MKIWKTKTFWGGVAAIATGVGIIVSGDIPTGISTIATGVVAIFLRDGIKKIDNK